MNNDHIHHGIGFSFNFLLMLCFLLVFVLYIFATIVSNRHHKSWPLFRYFFWILGVLSAGVAVVGPLANRTHIDFTAHMTGHLLLGMLAPLFLALAAPMTLVLRTLSVKSSRRLSRILKSGLFRILSDPLIASFLNVGGLYLLYTTNLYMMMQQSLALHILVHLHVFLAGYMFTVSMVYLDLSPHRTSYIYRAIVFIIALAGHGILSKYIYSNPPSGVTAVQAENGGMLMYYGGDVIDIAIIIIFCFQWFKATRPRKSININKSTIKMLIS